MFWPFKKRDTRAIFHYSDGIRRRLIDPMVAWRALDQHPDFDLHRHPALIVKGDWESVTIGVAAIREIFGIKPLGDQGGLTEAETLGVLWSFMDYAEALKKNTRTRPTSPSRSDPSALDRSTMRPGSDCTSISSEPKSEPRPESSSRSAQPTPTL